MNSCEESATGIAAHLLSLLDRHVVMVPRQKISVIANWHCRRIQSLSAVSERSVVESQCTKVCSSPHSRVYVVENQESGKASVPRTQVSVPAASQGAREAS